MITTPCIYTTLPWYNTVSYHAQKIQCTGCQKVVAGSSNVHNITSISFLIRFLERGEVLCYTWKGTMQGEQQRMPEFIKQFPLLEEVAVMYN